MLTKRHGLYLGGKADAKNRAKLESWGVTHILNVTPEKDVGVKSGVPNYFPRAFSYKRVSVYDAGSADLLRYAAGVADFVRAGLHHGSVLVHCRQGMSRGPTCVLFFLVRDVPGLTTDDALRTVREKRSVANPIPAFVAQVRAWETRCVARRRGGPTTTTRQAIIGPDPPPSRTDDEQRRGKAIGPALPPQKKMGPSLPETTTSITGDSKRSVATIGPALPPKKMDPRLPKTGPTTTATVGDLKRDERTIGPAPSPSIENAARSDDSTEPTLTSPPRPLPREGSSNRTGAKREIDEATTPSASPEKKRRTNVVVVGPSPLPSTPNATSSVVKP